RHRGSESGKPFQRKREGQRKVRLIVAVNSKLPLPLTERGSMSRSVFTGRGGCGSQTRAPNEGAWAGSPWSLDRQYIAPARGASLFLQLHFTVPIFRQRMLLQLGDM